MELQNSLPIMDLTDNETGCCPRFNPALWDDRMFSLDSYKFAKAFSKSILHMPLDLGKVMTKTMQQIEGADAEAKDRYLILSHDLSSWKCEHYFLVEKDVPSLEMAHLNGKYITKVFDGPFKDIPKWMVEMKGYVEQKGYHMKDMMSFYTTCPDCAKHYGHNFVVLFASID